MKAMKSLLVGATACAAVAAAPALVALPRRDAQPDCANSDGGANLKTMVLHGDRVAYRDEGTGPVLMLVHGMGGSSNSWSGVIPLISRFCALCSRSRAGASRHRMMLWFNMFRAESAQ